ncbi:hypothetical protein EV363DRAFT_806653 [Boletus edulis]|nr:hypothetical protein EV363DRAFT_806653 [Boletus edulis]
MHICAQLLPNSSTFSHFNIQAPPKEPRSPLPDWLADTFYRLEPDHPLRGLLSPSRINTETKSHLPAVALPGASREEEIFAFSPFQKQEETPDAAYRDNGTSNMQGHVPSTVSISPTLSHLQLEVSTNPLPFSTPGRFAPLRRSRSIVDRAVQKTVILVSQQVSSQTTNIMHPPASRLRSDDVIGRPQFTQAFSNLVQDIEPPSDLQEPGANLNHHQVFQADCDNLNVYVTPGPTFACSRPVYFDSPTEDPSLSDPLQPELYELDLNAIDFRWHPFLRSNAPESEMNKRPVSPSSPLGYAVPNQVTGCDQSGWNTRFSVDKGEHGASSEDLPSLAEDVDILNHVGTVLPSNVSTTTTKLSTVSNTIGPWSSRINDVREVWPAFLPPGVFLSPVRDQPEPALLAAGHVLPRVDGEDIHTCEEPLLRGETKAIRSEVLGVRPSTPIRQAPVSPPSTPHKLRSSQLCEIPRVPVCKTSSALSWMIPPKHSQRTITVRDDVDHRFSCVSADSRDSIESWSQTS